MRSVAPIHPASRAAPAGNARCSALPRALRLTVLRFVLLAGLALAAAAYSSRDAYASATPQAANAPCHGPTLVTVVAHLDDDLLFVDPGISDRLRAGWCIVTVHLIGGANRSPFSYVLKREEAIRQAYSRMAGVANAWTETTIALAGQPVHRMTLDAAPRVTLLELRLPGGDVRGPRVPLGLLWDEGETLWTYPMNGDGSGAAHYDRATLIATLGAILFDANEIYTLNPDTVPFLEHPDHIYTARITREAARAFGVAAPIGYHLTYVTSGLPANVAGAQARRKRDTVASYFAIDGGDTAQAFGEYEWNGDWVARRYVHAMTATTPPRPGQSANTSEMPDANLVNVYTSACLTANRAGTTPRLAACDGGVAQLWRWQPLASYPGNAHDAALMNASTNRCVAEQADTLTEQACDANDIAQRWTPWDFGIVRTPLGHCLGERDGHVTVSPCGLLTSAYRWAPTLHSRWTDMRLEGPLYGDVTGSGTPSAVYVTRRTDGPGFDVWVADLAPGARATRWYQSAVHFDARALAPSCDGAALCFDDTRFVLADFAGTGHASLLAITADASGDTVCWLFASTGTRFAAPVLWYRGPAALDPSHTQQYVAADFDGRGHADLLAVQPREDGDGFDLMVLTGDGAHGLTPVRWATARALPPTARFFAAHVAHSARVQLVAVETGDDAITVTRWASTGHRFTPLTRAVRLPMPSLRGTLVKLAMGPLTTQGDDGLAVLAARAPSATDTANIDVWTIAGGRQVGAPMHAGTLDGVSWADALPALVAPRDGANDRRATLVLFTRTNVALDEYHFTGGAPRLLAYPLTARGKGLGAEQDWGALPGRYTETLRVERLH